MILTGKQQEMILKILTLNEKTVQKDFIPSIFSYYASFYRTLKESLHLIRTDFPNGKPVYRLTFEGFLLASLLRDIKNKEEKK